MGSASKEKLGKIWTKIEILFMRLRVSDFWSNRGRTVSIDKNWLYIVPKIYKSQDFKTTVFNIFLACIFLSVRLNLMPGPSKLEKIVGTPGSTIL